MTSTDGSAPDESGRLLAQIRTLHALADRLNQLQDVAAIGEAITAELRTIIDYHSCRVYRLQPNGTTLLPVAFSGELTEYEGDTIEDLMVEVGQGLTGHAAEVQESYYSPNALTDPYAEDIPGTDEIVESMLGVPFVYGGVLVGVLVLSKLGEDQFDEQDIRVMEVFAPHAAVAMINAELLERERDSARRAEALLALSQTLTSARGVDDVLRESIASIPGIIPCFGVLAYRRDPHGNFRLAATGGPSPWPQQGPPSVVPRAIAEPFLYTMVEPYVLTRDVVRSVPKEARTLDVDADVLVAPVRWDPEQVGTLIVVAQDADRPFTERELDLMRGIADIASLALGNAGSFEQLAESRDRLRALDEMKTMFLEAVSHDLRTPLSTVLGIALTLQDGAVDAASPDGRDLIDRLAANARKLERLLADLLDLDRLMRGIVEPSRRPTDLPELLRRVVKEVEGLGGHAIQLDLEPATANIDAPKVERIAENLLVNATRHTPAEATIWVRCRTTPEGAVLIVDDEGPGVPPDVRESIFEPFRQGPGPNRHNPGVGIGLSLVARFAELHGGRAWVEDRQGGGASFRVLLPDA